MSAWFVIVAFLTCPGGPGTCDHVVQLLPQRFGTKADCALAAPGVLRGLNGDGDVTYAWNCIELNVLPNMGAGTRR